MEEIWRKNVPANVPAEIDPSRYSSVWAMAEDAIEQYGGKTAFSNFGSELSFKDIDRLSRDLAAYLQNEAGLRKGDRIAVMCPNILAFPVTLYANMRSGLVQVNVNPQYTARELEHQLNDADTETIVIFAGSTPVLSEVLARTKIKNIIVADLGDCGNTDLPTLPIDAGIKSFVSFSDALARGKDLEYTPPELKQSDLLFLQYTGGTTGVSKGAALSHGNLVANILQFGVAQGHRMDTGKEIIITALPLYHIFALMVNCITFFTHGGVNVLITNPGDMPGFVAELAKWKFTAICGVNTLFNGLLHTPGFMDLDFSGLKISAGGGTAIQSAISDKWFKATGLHITEGYGLSETSPILTFNLGDTDHFTSTIGVPMPSTQISLRDENDNEVAIGEPGEICAKGPQIMQGYWRKPEATAEVTTKDGFFRTGDVAILTEDGYFKIVDRIKDMILVSGFNVYPNEIEAVVAKIDGVLEAACIGIPDERTDEAVKVFVVRTEGSTIKAEDVVAFCRTELTGYKVPRQVAFIDALPKSAVGKILRRELREE
jgi:long-chain acyl-CoA synthetase